MPSPKSSSVAVFSISMEGDWSIGVTVGSSTPGATAGSSERSLTSAPDGGVALTLA